MDTEVSQAGVKSRFPLPVDVLGLGVVEQICNFPASEADRACTSIQTVKRKRGQT